MSDGRNKRFPNLRTDAVGVLVRRGVRSRETKRVVRQFR